VKVVTATSTGQGDRPGDYCWTVEGELVVVLDACARDRADPDGGCGCGRGFAGMTSRRATPTAMVRDVDVAVEEYYETVAAHLVELGYGPDALGDLEFEELAEDTAADLLRWADTWPAGSVLGRRLDSVHVRSTGGVERPGRRLRGR
jgi:hypothetical protein